MKTLRYVLGIDGGGTKTTAEICSASGAVLATVVGGPSNFLVIGPRRAAETILSVVQRCCTKAGVAFRTIDAIVAGLSGAGREAERRLMLRELKRLANERKLRLPHTVIESDAMIALEGAFPGKAGIIAIVGTGSILFGKDERGTLFRAGGWGRILGDEGSGYTIGREGLRAVARMLDGGTPQTMLASLVARRFGFTSQGEIIRSLYRENFDLASVAPFVLEAAERGDPPSLRILRQSADELASLLDVLIKRVKRAGLVRSRTIPVALTGSLGTGTHLYARLLAARIRRLPSVSLEPPQWSPVHGASLMALGFIHST